MALRIGDYVYSGELRNTRRNGVFGWIEFAPDYGVRIELTGNFSGELEGKRIRFQVPRRQQEDFSDPPELPDEVETLADRQIGVIGDVVRRTVKVPTVPIDEFLSLSKEDQQTHVEEKECLYLEWFSQNGRVVAEIVEPQLAVVDSEDTESELDDNSGPAEDGQFALGVTEIRFDDDGNPHVEQYDVVDDDAEEEEEEDPYGLFDQEFNDKLAESLGPVPNPEPETGDAEPRPRPWDEVIPGLDPETKELYDQWDEIFEGKRDEPVSYLFQEPLRLPLPERVETDEEAEPLVRAILAQLALLSVALDVCEHYTPLQTYKLLMQEILPSAKVHPNLAESEIVQHYSTTDFCTQCEAEFDAEYDAMQDGDEFDDDTDADESDQSPE